MLHPSMGGHGQLMDAMRRCAIFFSAIATDKLFVFQLVLIQVITIKLSEERGQQIVGGFLGRRRVIREGNRGENSLYSCIKLSTNKHYSSLPSSSLPSHFLLLSETMVCCQLTGLPCIWKPALDWKSLSGSQKHIVYKVE